MKSDIREQATGLAQPAAPATAGQLPSSSAGSASQSSGAPQPSEGPATTAAAATKLPSAERIAAFSSRLKRELDGVISKAVFKEIRAYGCAAL